MRLAQTAFDDYYEMLADDVRMAAYEAAIQSTIQPGDRVVDLGAGLGILGFMALRAGAKHLVAIERGDAIELARSVAEHNGLLDRVTFIRAFSNDAQLAEPADVLISETLGSLAIDENTLPFTIDGRRRLLRPGGRMIPERLRVSLAPMEDHALFARRVSFWRAVRGIDFKPAVDVMASKLQVVEVKAHHLLGRPRELVDIDLHTVENPEVAKHLRLVVSRPGTLHGFAGWFHAFLTDSVVIHTSPDQPPTHWKQAFLPVPQPVKLGYGDFVDLRLNIGGQDPRSDDTRLNYSWFCSQRDDPPGGRGNTPCPCGSGTKLRRCCG